ncbi:MAG: hypothetical protein MUF52_05025 [Syntrophobacteraceae bacterium]|jgi:hypothetical protein|nr:hypothetical protein [Syntrophobacteraceae bacterium]MCU0587502.1 hypothetical protein [Syntrophobacteraceae bacterium]
MAQEEWRVKFYCPGCKATFSLADDKLPADKEIRALCPRCRIPVERAQEEPRAAVAPPAAGSTVGYSPVGMDDPEMDHAPSDIIEDGVRAALVCVWDTARSYKMEQTLRQLDYYVSTAFSPKEALEKLNRNQYDLVVLDEVYGGTKAGDNVVLQHFQLLPMHSRRHLFLCLLSEQLPTLERMSAFNHGVDMILHVQDMDKAKVLFVRAMKDHKHFYKVFADELEKRGEY